MTRHWGEHILCHLASICRLCTKMLPKVCELLKQYSHVLVVLRHILHLGDVLAMRNFLQSMLHRHGLKSPATGRHARPSTPPRFSPPTLPPHSCRLFSIPFRHACSVACNACCIKCFVLCHGFGLAEGQSGLQVVPGKKIMLLARRDGAQIRFSLRAGTGSPVARAPWKEEWGGGASVENPHFQRVHYCELLASVLVPPVGLHVHC